MKIFAKKVYAPDDLAETWSRKESACEKPWRLVRESDWHKIMAVVRAAEKWEVAKYQPFYPPLDNALSALRNHLEKQKDSSK
jgi:hypothetical protein